MAYDQTITASGGTGNITLTVNNIQNAIAGLVLPSSGSNSLTIGGKPTAAGTESFTIMATDALGATTSTTYSITVTNNPPALAGIEGTALDYTEGNPATAVTSSLAVSDAESATLAGATIWIGGNYQSGEDLLSFVNTGNIAGSWDAATGTLTLSGSDTLANYQAALQAVTYVNNCLDPSTATRTVSFRVNDGQADSNVLPRDIAVQLLDPAVNDVVLGGLDRLVSGQRLSGRHCLLPDHVRRELHALGQRRDVGLDDRECPGEQRVVASACVRRRRDFPGYPRLAGG